MEIRNLSDTEFEALFLRMLKELSEDLSSIKKQQQQQHLVRNKGYANWNKEQFIGKQQ